MNEEQEQDKPINELEKMEQTAVLEKSDNDYAEGIFINLNHFSDDYRKELLRLQNTRDRALALTKIDEIKMWINSGLLTFRKTEEIVLENSKKNIEIPETLIVKTYSSVFMDLTFGTLNTVRINFIRNDASTAIRIKVWELLMWTRKAAYVDADDA